MNHAVEASKFTKNKDRLKWHDETLWHVRSKRDMATAGIDEWEELREIAAQVKDHTLSNLDHYLELFEKNAIKNGIHIHWAEDAKEHNQLVWKILQKHKAIKVVKSKSMLTEECHLNDFLEKNGIEVVDTDLGERIVQFAKEPPSHIVMPAIHKKKEEISTIFNEHLQTEKGNNDPVYLTLAARKHLREKFLQADVAISGVNFGIAATGGFVVCTNEGNADMGVNLANVHIASMGIEKLIPRLEDLGVFLRLLARSATGQPITTYSSHFHGATEGKELHIILVDNGRSEQLGRDKFYRSLRCIRCGACMNTCPIYRRSGGHSYGSTVPGPIGSILSPGQDLKKYSSLPFASTLCGSCSEVCPVKIDIHEQLYYWRQEIAKAGNLPLSKKLSMQITGTVLSSGKTFSRAGKFARSMLQLLPKWVVTNRFNNWSKQRDLPDPPKESFREWYKKNRT